MTYVNNTGNGNPVFDYSSRDYVSIYSDLVARIPIYLPEWTSTSPSDFGIVMIQMYAYVGDLLHYYIDRLAGEAFIQTATQPSSIINLAAMLDYTPTLATGATVSLSVTASPTLLAPITIAPGTQFTTSPSSNQPAVVFQTVADSEQPVPGPQIISPGATLTNISAVQGITYTSLPNVSNTWEAFGIPSTVTPISIMGVSNGSVNQAYQLFYSPVSANSFFVYVDLGTGAEQWTYVTSLINFGPYDRVFSNFVDGNNNMWIQFGDGVNGYVPPLGSPMYCTYQVGAGSTGNVGSSTITETVSAAFGISGVTNPISASGGTNPESLASIQTNAPASLRTLNRAVTVSDFGTLAIQVAGVQWASAVEATYQLVNLYVCPFGGGTPSNLLQSQVNKYINNLSMANTSITIYPPSYVLVDLTIEISVYPSYDQTAVTSTVHAALATLLLLPNTGFGFRVALGLVYQTVLAQPGVNYAIVQQLNREVWVNLIKPITASDTVQTLFITPLPESVSIGDSLVLTSPDGLTTQTVSAVSTAAVGATTIPVAFIATGNFPAGTTMQDIGLPTIPITQDVVMLANEIPVAGTFVFITSGGLPSPAPQIFTYSPAGILTVG